LILDDREPAFEPIIRDVESLLGVHLTVHDLGGMFHDPSGQPLLGPRRGSHKLQPACLAGFGPRCTQHCMGEIHSGAAQAPEPFVDTCWKGLRQVVAPFRRQGSHLGCVFAGIWRAEEAAPPADAPPAAARERASLGTLDSDTGRRMGRTLSTLAHGLLMRFEQMHEQAPPARTRMAQVRRFLRYRAGEDVRLGDLAEELHLSESRTSHVVSEMFGRSYQELLMEERINRARTLLLSTDLTAGQVGRRVGMPNEYHFNRTFKRLVGVPPGRFRTQGVGR
jgi:AraC-like DNA-binding protein